MIVLNMLVYSLRRIYNVNQCDIKDVSVLQKRSFCLLPFPLLLGLKTVLRARQNMAQLVKMLSDTTQQNVK